MWSHHLRFYKNLPGRVYIFTRFFILYGAFLGLLAAIVIGLSYRSVRALELEAAEKGMILATHTRDLIDAHLEQIDRMLTRFERSYAIRSFLNMNPLQKGSSDLSIVLDAFNELGDYRLSNDFVRAVYLFGARNGVMLSSDAIWLDFAQEYAAGMAYGDCDYKTFAAECLSGSAHMAFRPSTSMTINKIKMPVVLCMNSLPLWLGRAEYGMAIAAIDDRRLNELLSGLYGAASGGAFLMDTQGKMLSAVGSAKAREAALRAGPFSGTLQKKLELGGEEWLVSVEHSSRFGVSIVSAAPRLVFAARLGAIVRQGILVGLVFALLAALIAWYFVKRGAQPLLDIAASTQSATQSAIKSATKNAIQPRLNSIKAKDKAPSSAPEGSGARTDQAALPETDSKNLHRDDFVDTIKEGIRRLSSQKDALAALLERQRPALRHSVLKELLEGSLYGDDEIELALADADIDLDMTGGFVVVILQYQGLYNLGPSPQSVRIGLLSLEEALETQWKGRAFSCGLGGNSSAVLFTLARADWPEFAGELELFHSGVLRERGIECVLAVGDFALSLADIPASFKKAQRFIEYLQDHPAGRHVLINEKWLPALPASDVYPLEMETKLIAAVKAGSSSALEATLKELVEGARGDAREFSYRRLIYGLEGTLFRLSGGDKAAAHAIQAALAASSDEEKLQIVLASLTECTEKRAALRGSDDAALMRRLDDYLAARCTDMTLTLYAVASDFGKKESWLYGFFKRYTGETFATRLETLRLERSKSLLAQSILSVDDIAAQVGYGSAHSFRRAFKRRYSILPAEYRDAQQNRQQSPQQNRQQNPQQKPQQGARQHTRY